MLQATRGREAMRKSQGKRPRVMTATADVFWLFGIKRLGRGNGVGVVGLGRLTSTQAGQRELAQPFGLGHM